MENTFRLTNPAVALTSSLLFATSVTSPVAAQGTSDSYGRAVTRPHSPDCQGAHCRLAGTESRPQAGSDNGGGGLVLVLFLGTAICGANEECREAVFGI